MAIDFQRLATDPNYAIELQNDGGRDGREYRRMLREGSLPVLSPTQGTGAPTTVQANQDNWGWVGAMPTGATFAAAPSAKGDGWGSLGPDLYTRSQDSEDPSNQLAHDTPDTFTRDGKTYHRVGNWDGSIPAYASGQGFESQMQYDPEFGWYLPEDTYKKIVAMAPDDFFSKFGPALWAGAMFAGPVAAHMAAGSAAGSAGASAGGSGGAAGGAGGGLGDFSLAQPGMGIGGQGTAGLGLSGTPTSLLTPEMIAAAGGEGALAGLPLAGSGTGAGLGLALTPGNAIVDAAANLASQAGVSLPPASLPSPNALPQTPAAPPGSGAPGAPSSGTPPTTPPGTTPPGAAPGATSALQRILDGTATADDWLKAGAKLGLAGLAANQAAGGGGGGGSVGDIADLQGEAAKEAMALAREQWAWNKARSDEMWPQVQKLIQQQLDIGDINAERSRSEWDIYQRLYLPAEERYAEQMMNWDTPDRRTQRIQEAVADVARGHDMAQGTLERNLSRAGVRPGGAGFVQAQADLSRSRAADTAGAMNTARRQVESEGIAGLERLTNIGRGRPSTSFAADQLALAAGNSGNANLNANTAATNAGLSAAQGWYGTGVNALAGQAGTQNAAHRNNVASSANFGRLLGQLFFNDFGFKDGGLVRRNQKSYANGGLVRKAQRKLEKMGFAQGGMVHGPGTTISDSIPAMIDGQEPAALSTGEAVLNAEAVGIVGEDFINRINHAGLERRRTGGGQTIEGEARRVG